MNNRRLGIVIILIMLFVCPPQLWAQNSQGLTASEKAELSGTRKQLATIVFAGLAGAILGLSTLSFYGRPQEHLTNIAIGGALGVISGAIFTTYKAATNPYDAYDMNAQQIVPSEWPGRELAWNAQKAPTAGFTFRWEF